MKSYKVLWVLLALIILPTLGRLVWFYRGWYSVPQVPEINDTQIILPLPPYKPFVDEPTDGDGLAVIDLSHNNNLEIDDLAPLRDRLTVRGVRVRTFDGSSGSLGMQLRGATALVVVAPASPYSQEERDAVMAFVEDGGRVLLAADPTRPVPLSPEELLDMPSIFFPTSAVPAINSLANAFGVIYFDDYLYNMVDNEGNYRNVKFTTLDEEHPLTQDLEEVIFFAAHSLRTKGLSLITGDENILSPLRTGETELTAAALAADGLVLALGDVSVLTPSYHVIADNNRFLSNISDWLATAARDWDLKDFPYLYAGPVDLVQTFGDLLDPRLIVAIDGLQAVFEQAELSLTLQAEADSDHDVLLLGTFSDLDLVERYLTSAGISVTLEGVDRGGQVGENIEDTITIEGLGTLDIKGTILYVVDHSKGRVVILVLAEDNEKTIQAVNRLGSVDFSGCVQDDDVMVCSTGELLEGVEEKEREQPVEEDGGRVFILYDDDGPRGARTAAAEFETILKNSYSVTIWSTSRDGIPSSQDLAGYDVIIVDSGDYAFDTQDTKTLAVLDEIEMGILYVGAQSFPISGTNTADLNDVEVVNGSHPLAAGFEEGEVISLTTSESGVSAFVIDVDDLDGITVSAVFARGPNSLEAGAPVLIAFSDERAGVRLIRGYFAFYRLPEAAQRTFAINAVEWLLGP